MGIRRFEDIKAWQAARRLSQALDRHSGSSEFRNRKLLNQMEDCADSAMANIIEGFDSQSDREFLRFLKIAFRSVSEFQSHLHVASDKKYLNTAAFDELYSLATETKALIGGFMRYLKNCRRNGRPKKP